MITTVNIPPKEMKCYSCIHRHVCKYMDEATQISEDNLKNPFITIITTCRYYTEQTLEPIKIN